MWKCPEHLGFARWRAACFGPAKGEYEIRNTKYEMQNAKCKRGTACRAPTTKIKRGYWMNVRPWGMNWGKT